MEGREKKVLLMILDGWGLTPQGDEDISAIAKANTPFMDKIWQENPHSQLLTHGLSVGLPEGQMGNSEVGHLNLGAGRVIYQELVKINMAVKDRIFHHNKVLIDAFAYAKRENKKVHIMGLLSDGGIHSHIDHLKAICDVAHDQLANNVYIHAFTDGRDTDPKSGISFLEELESHMQRTSGKLASITGRYYAMDRGRNWDITSIAYQALVHAKASRVEAYNWKQAIEHKYLINETDEFIKPVILTDNEIPLATINEGDVVISFNYRTDRARQITQALTQQDFPEFNMRKMKLRYITMTPYDRTYKDVAVLFETDNLNNTLGEVLSKAGKRQIRIAETIKYPHVTYFFSGGREVAFEGEERIMAITPDVATFDLKPEMNAEGIRDAIIPKIQEGAADFICLNFANPDMVGHTGDISATIRACETVDACAETVSRAALENNYAVIVIADHGNAEKMRNPDGSPFTAHTTNPVPCILLGYNNQLKLRNGKLSDIAPTVLSIMGITIPPEMNGDVLLSNVLLV